MGSIAANIITVLIISVVVGCAIRYIFVSKKKGVKCIGCPAAGTCSKCQGCQSQK